MLGSIGVPETPRTTTDNVSRDHGAGGIENDCEPSVEVADIGSLEMIGMMRETLIESTSKRVTADLMKSQIFQRSAHRSSVTNTTVHVRIMSSHGEQEARRMRKAGRLTGLTSTKASNTNTCWHFSCIKSVESERVSAWECWRFDCKNSVWDRNRQVSLPEWYQSI
jgi:hypothetical protein